MTKIIDPYVIGHFIRQRFWPFRSSMRIVLADKSFDPNPPAGTLQRIETITVYGDALALEQLNHVLCRDQAQRIVG